MAITLPVDGCVLNFFGGPRPYPLTTLERPRPHPLTSLELYSLANNNEPKSPDTKKKTSLDLKRFNKALHTDALVAICLSLRDFGTQRAVSLLGYTRSRTFLHISSSVAPSGRPDLASSSKDVLPCLNSPSQNST